MKANMYKICLSLFLLLLLAISGCKNGGSQPQPAQSGTDPLPSWNEGAAKQAIVTFVKAVSYSNSPNYVPPAARVATFDNDGTLWAEQPLYFQVFFIFERLKELAPQHPEWKSEQPFKAVLENDHQTMKTFHVPDILKLAGATHTGMSQEAFESAARKFITTAKHPQRGVLFTQLVYQPMLELLDYLHQNDFKVFIVSGGGIDFIRAFSEDVYGIPRENVIGTAIQTEFVMQDGRALLMRKMEIVPPVDDKEGKPVNLHRFIGRRPILAFGNSDGDLQMLQYTAAGLGPSLMLLLHHDDAEREWAYDRQSSIGRLDKAWDIALERRWTVVSIRNDFKQVFP